jgi:hypothetical protein
MQLDDALIAFAYVRVIDGTRSAPEGNAPEALT